jgi:hypothetical protein
MAKKKTAAKKKAGGSKKRAGKKKPAARRKAPVKKKLTFKGKLSPVKARIVVRRRTIAATRAPREISSGSERSSLGSNVTRAPRQAKRGMGDEAGGQSGDLQGLSREEEAGAESVEELVEEGQAFEADVIDGVENAPDADHGPVRTHDRLEDDVPPEERTDEV